jgi:hypothetical protein
MNFSYTANQQGGVTELLSAPYKGSPPLTYDARSAWTSAEARCKLPRTVDRRMKPIFR